MSSSNIALKNGTVESGPEATNNQEHTPDWCNGAATASLLRSHLEKHHLPQERVSAEGEITTGTYEELSKKELAIAADINSGVSRRLYDYWALQSVRVQAKLLNGIEKRLSEPLKTRHDSFLFAPGANLDHSAGNSAIASLIDSAIKEFGLKALSEKVSKGPSDSHTNGANISYWTRADHPLELIASLVRIGSTDYTGKVRIRASNEVREWMRNTLILADIDTKPSLGSSPAVCAGLAKVLEFNPTLIAQGNLGDILVKNLPQNLRILDGQNKITKARNLTPVEVNNDHFALFMNDSSLPGIDVNTKFTVEGREFSLSDMTKLDALITGSDSAWSEFGNIPSGKIGRLASKNSVLILSGVQNLSDDSTSNNFLMNVKTLSDHGTAVALLYVKSKYPDKEIGVFGRMKEEKSLAFIGINTEEASDLLTNIAKDQANKNSLECRPFMARLATRQAVTAQNTDPKWDFRNQAPDWMIKTGHILREVLGVPVFRIRGRWFDLIVSDNKIECPTSEITDALFAGRKLAVLKVGCYPQLIRSKEDIAVIKNPPYGITLAAFCDGADALQKNYGMTGIERELFERTGSFTKGNTRFTTVPIDPMIRYEGSTVSAGDYMDSSFCMLAANFLRNARNL